MSTGMPFGRTAVHSTCWVQAPKPSSSCWLIICIARVARSGWLWGNMTGAAVADTSLERLFRRDDVPVREKCLCRLLYETAARAQEVLSLNFEDVDLDNKRARTTSKGGDTEWLHFQSGSARLLPRIIAGRQTGPLFLADRRPAPARTPATVDVCPVTGRGRLSYERAEYLFKQHSRRISRTGLTLHHLRHSALTTLADAKRLPAPADGQKPPQEPAIPPALVHPSAEAVAAMTAAHDPAARRRQR
jgi:integrase